MSLMRVVMVSRFPRDPETPRGGVESVTVALARKLRDFPDVELHIVTSERGVRAPVVDEFGRARIHRLRRSGWPLVVDLVCGPSRRAALDYVLGLRPDVVHTHEPFGRGLGRLPCAQVSTVHGFEAENVKADRKSFGWVRAPLWLRVEKAGWQRQRHIISIAQYVRDKLAPHVTAAIHDIENPVDERFFDIPRKTEPGRIICVGWVRPRKNTVGSIDAFAQVAPHFPAARLVIAGQAQDPDYKQKVDDAIARHGLAPQVELLGHVNRQRLMDELGRAAVLLLPSLQENAPMAIEEAMAAGVPAVVANRCGMPNMVTDGECGYLIDPTNPTEIADRLNQILRDPVLHATLSNGARERARRQFHPAAIAARTVEVYKQAIRDFAAAGATRPALVARECVAEGSEEAR